MIRHRRPDRQRPPPANGGHTLHEDPMNPNVQNAARWSAHLALGLAAGAILFSGCSAQHPAAAKPAPAAAQAKAPEAPLPAPPAAAVAQTPNSAPATPAAGGSDVTLQAVDKQGNVAVLD